MIARYSVGKEARCALRLKLRRKESIVGMPCKSLCAVCRFVGIGSEDECQRCVVAAAVISLCATRVQECIVWRVSALD